MNIWGKVLATLVIVAALLSTYFTAKMIQVRNSWAAKASKFEVEQGQLATRLATDEQKIARLTDEVQQTLREWGITIPADTRLSPPGSGRVEIVAGSNQNLKDKQVIHGFELRPDGTSIYRGPFEITTLQPSDSALRATWRVRGPDASTWQPGQWRWRTMIPSGYSDHFDEQISAFGKADEAFLDRTNTLKIQERLIVESERQRKLRIAEIVGGDELPKDEALLPEYREGLIAPLERTEEERNAILLEIADLRRQVRAERDAVLRLTQENIDLALKLPQPTTAVSRRDVAP